MLIHTGIAIWLWQFRMDLINDELHFTNIFHDQNVYIFAFKMLLTRSSDMSYFAVTTYRKFWSKNSEKLSPFLSVVCAQHRILAFCILRIDPENLFF